MQTDILIAGAGLSGLSLAAALQERGLSFQLLEARERIGGRILTLENHYPGIGTTLADIGPSWIWPGQPLIGSLLQKLGIASFEQFSDGLLVFEDADGRVRRDVDFSTMAGSLRIDGGIARIPGALAAQLPADRLLLSHRIRGLRQEADGWQADIESGDERLCVRARAVVLALPPRVVCETIEFDPPLPVQATRELASIPTWMAGQAKLFALYDEPFWRNMGLSGDAISQRGPLVELHDASPADAAYGALFGFVGPAAEDPAREASRLRESAARQLVQLFGPAAAEPLDILIKDWATESFTATRADFGSRQHPQQGMPPGVGGLAEQGLLFASSELARGYGGLVEGALEVAAATFERLLADKPEI